MIRLGNWQFDNIPDYFVARYFFEIVKWAKLRPFPCTYLITFNEGDLADDSPDPEQGKVLPGAWLLARCSRRTVEVEPLSDRDRDRINKHCAKMQLYRVPSQSRLVEPPRPGIPTIPWRH